MILPFAFVSAEVETELKTSPPRKALLSVTAPAGVDLDKSKWSLNTPNPLFDGAMAGSGSILSDPDPDGIWRRLPLIARYDGQSWATLWLAAAMKLIAGAAPPRYPSPTPLPDMTIRPAR